MISFSIPGDLLRADTQSRKSQLSLCLDKIASCLLPLRLLQLAQEH